MSARTRHGLRRPRRPVAKALRMYVILLPVSAVTTYCLLLADRTTVATPAGLARARFGLPLNWVEQDLSRYEPSTFPTTIEFAWRRAWYDPIATEYDGMTGILNVLIVGVFVTVVALVLIRIGQWAFARRASRRSDPAGAAS